MASDFGNLEGFVDAIADRVLGKLTSRPNQGPIGEPPPQLPDLTWGSKDALPRVFHPRLHVQGLELTQSTQYYGTGYGPDNSVPIVRVMARAPARVIETLTAAMQCFVGTFEFSL